MRSNYIPLIIGIVLSTVQFDDQTLIETTEINDISLNRLLTSKSKSPEASGSKMTPKDSFDIRGMLSQKA